MATVGAAVREIRIADNGGGFRVIYVAKFAGVVFVLHCSQKKTQKTRQADIELAAKPVPAGSTGDEAMTKTYARVWDAIAKSPEEAETLRVCSDLMDALEGWVKRSGLTRAAAAKRLGVSQPRVSSLMRGKISEFSLDALMALAARAGLRVEVRIFEPA